MSAPKRITDEQVVRAITSWGGNVTGAAAELSIQPKNLRNRLSALGIDVSAIRSGSIGPVRIDTARPVSYRPARMGPLITSGSGGEKNGGGLYPSEAGSSTLTPVQSTATAAESDAVPIKAIPRRQIPLRLRPELRERLRDAKLDLGARYREEYDENGILETFFVEAFDGWLKSKLEPAPAKLRRRTPPEGNTE